MSNRIINYLYFIPYDIRNIILLFIGPRTRHDWKTNIKRESIIINQLINNIINEGLPQITLLKYNFIKTWKSYNIDIKLQKKGITKKYMFLKEMLSTGKAYFSKCRYGGDFIIDSESYSESDSESDSESYSESYSESDS